MSLAGTEVEETYVERNLIDYISSSSANDTQTIIVEGHKAGDDISATIKHIEGTAIVTTSTEHGFKEDEWINVAGANQAEYNGIVKVDRIINDTSFEYTVDSAAVTPATGTITVNSYNKTFVKQEVTLNGQTPVQLGTPLARVHLAHTAPQNKAANLVGTIYIAEGNTVTGGVPNTDTDVHLIIAAGKNKSEKAAYILAQDEFLISTGFHGHLLEKASAFADVELEYKLEGTVFTGLENIVLSSTVELHTEPWRVLPPNTDIRLQATADGAGTDVGGTFHGFIAKVTTDKKPKGW